MIALAGLNHFVQTDRMAGYARHKGLPAPKAGVLASGVVLVLGGLSVAAGVFPVPGALAVAVFLLTAALTFHGFRAVPEDQQQTGMTQFLNNVALAGGALVVASFGTQNWTHSLDLALF